VIERQVENCDSDSKCRGTRYREDKPGAFCHLFGDKKVKRKLGGARRKALLVRAKNPNVRHLFSGFRVKSGMYFFCYLSPGLRISRLLTIKGGFYSHQREENGSSASASCAEKH